MKTHLGIDEIKTREQAQALSNYVFNQMQIDMENAMRGLDTLDSLLERWGVEPSDEAIKKAYPGKK